VATVVAMVADAMTTAEILAELPELEAEDVAQALRYAASAAGSCRCVILRGVPSRRRTFRHDWRSV
jgi:Protein of unknown function (DUF433)